MTDDRKAMLAEVARISTEASTHAETAKWEHDGPKPDVPPLDLEPWDRAMEDAGFRVRAGL